MFYSHPITKKKKQSLTKAFILRFCLMCALKCCLSSLLHDKYKDITGWQRNVLTSVKFQKKFIVFIYNSVTEKALVPPLYTLLCKMKQQPSLLWTSLYTDHVDLLPSTPSGPNLTFSHRPCSAASTGADAQGGGAFRAF